MPEKPTNDHLSTRKGPASVPDINPRLRVVASPTMDAETLFVGIRSGDRSMLSRAITLVESTRLEDRPAQIELLDRCMAHAGGAVRIGISGSPGVGKSTFIDVFGSSLVDRGYRVAVLAVDPSSERSGGSILGDKTRMGRLVGREQAYIRPSPSSGSLGGVARATRPTIMLCEAAFFDIVLVETVGVGQSETTVRSMVDTFLLLAQAGAGDELQGIKRGIMEAADIVAVTKADGDGAERAENARSALAASLQLLPPEDAEWRPPVLAISAVTGTGLAELAGVVDDHTKYLRTGDRLSSLRASQALRWMRDEVTAGLLDRVVSDPLLASRLSDLEHAVVSGATHPFRAADDLVRSFVDT